MVGVLSLLVVLVEGILSFFSPCIIPVLPIYFSLLSTSDEDSKSFLKSRLLRNTIAFVLGISTVFFILGLSIQSLSSMLGQYQNLITLTGGFFIVIMGLFYLGIIQINVLNREKRLHLETKKMSVLSAYLLGLTFSFGWTPCVGPMLASVLIMALGSESALSGNILIFIYTLGFIVPFIIMALFYNRMIRFMSLIKNNMNKVKVIGGAILVLSGAVMMFQGIRQQNVVTPTTAERVNQDAAKAYDFDLIDQFGINHSLSQYEGKVIYLTFWATWCPNCNRELPILNKLYAEYGKNQEDVVILTVTTPNLGSEGDEDYVKLFIEQHNYTQPVMMDHQGQVARKYGVRAVPTSFLINRDGNVVTYIPGAIGEDSINKLIQQVLSE